VVRARGRRVVRGSGEGRGRRLWPLESSGECAGVRRAGEGVGEGGASEVGNNRDGFFVGVECKVRSENGPSTCVELEGVFDATSEPW